MLMAEPVVYLVTAKPVILAAFGFGSSVYLIILA